MQKIYATFFLLACISAGRAENSLTLFIIPPPQHLDWSSPSGITWTAFEGNAESSNFHPIGHVMEEIKCDAVGSTAAVDEFSGMTTLEDSPEPDLIFNKGIGMGIFFYDFAGKLNDQSYVLDQLNQASQMMDRLVTLRYLVNPTTCARLVEYLKEYHDLGIDQHYGMYLRPRYKEGAGCTAFGESFLEIAGIMTPDIQQAWSTHVNVQEVLIGYPVDSTPVPVSTILFGLEAQHWAEDGESYRPLLVYDTEFFTAWTANIWNQDSLPANYSIDQTLYNQYDQQIAITVPATNGHGGTQTDYVDNGLMSLLIDARSIPTPTESIWLN